MPFFSYRASDSSGKLVRARIEMAAAPEVLEYLRQSGLQPIEIRQLHFYDMELSDLIQRRISSADLATLCQRLAFITGAGIQLPQAFQTLSEQYEKPYISKVLANIHQSLLRGRSLSAGVADSPLPNFMAALCRAGETTGSLSEVFENLTVFYQNEAKSRQSLAGALLYPALVTVMMLAVIVMAVTMLIPNYAAIFASEGITLPLPTRVLMAASGFIMNYGFVALIILFAVAAGAVLAFRTPRGRYLLGYIKLHLPVLGKLNRKYVNLRFCQCMGMLLKAGRSAPEAIESVKPVLGNTYLSPILTRLRTGLTQGRKMSDLMREANCFEPMLINMVHIGEETGSLPQILTQCAEYFQAETARSAELVGKLAEPLVTIVLGAVMAFVMLSVILPTFTLVNAF
jgi:type IV pilus assembly protein PilC